MKTNLESFLVTFIAVLTIVIIISCSDTTSVPPPSESTWQYVGDAGFTPENASGAYLVFDNNNTPYIAFDDSEHSNKVSVMKYDGNTWTYVGTSGISARGIAYLSFCIDNNGTPYIAYTDISDFKVSVMKFKSTDNTWDYVGNQGLSNFDAYYTSLALDNNGIPYIAFSNLGVNEIAVMKFENNNWISAGTTDFTHGTVDDISLAINNHNTPYIVFTDGRNDPLHTKDHPVSVMAFDGNNTWDYVGNQGISEGTAFFSSLTIDNSGTPYIAYQDWENGTGISVMKFYNNTWDYVGTKAFSMNGYVDQISISVDNNNSTPYVVYREVDNSNKAVVMKFNGNAWVTTGDPDIYNTGWLSLAIDSNGIPYIGFTDETNSYRASVMKYSQ